MQRRIIFGVCQLCGAPADCRWRDKQAAPVLDSISPFFCKLYLPFCSAVHVPVDKLKSMLTV